MASITICCSRTFPLIFPIMTMAIMTQTIMRTPMMTPLRTAITAKRVVHPTTRLDTTTILAMWDRHALC